MMHLINTVFLPSQLITETTAEAQRSAFEAVESPCVCGLSIFHLPNVSVYFNVLFGVILKEMVF